MPSRNRTHPSDSRHLRAVRHRPTANMAQRPQPERSHQITHRRATQPVSLPAREQPPTLPQQFPSKIPASHLLLACRSPCGEVARTVEGNREQPKQIWHPPTRKTTEWSNTAVAYMADGQQSAIGIPPLQQRNICGLPLSKTCMCAAATCHLVTLWRTADISGRYRTEASWRTWRVELCSGWTPLHTRHDDDYHD